MTASKNLRSTNCYSDLAHYDNAQYAKKIDALHKANFKGKIIVGGAPVTLEFAETIGSDSYAPDASLAVSLAREMLGID